MKENFYEITGVCVIDMDVVAIGNGNSLMVLEK
jgi:hypothetical protein